MAKRSKIVKNEVENERVGKAKRKVGAKGYKLPDPLPLGTVLTDVLKRKWVLGTSIGVGGFGEIYLASEEGKTGSEYMNVVKVEDHNNGPLFTEIHCLQRVGGAQIIEDWMKKKKLKFLGMPRFIGIGSQESENRKYRFMVMERYGIDLSKLLKKYRVFPLKCTYSIGIQVIDVLEYLHFQGYVHNDVKAANLLLGYGDRKKNQVYLVDFGLASKYLKDNNHKPHILDPRKAHDGTIEFTSRDAHSGAPFSRRGDLEILGYNMLRWLCGHLPWEENLKDPVYVNQQKSKFMSNIPLLMKTCFPSQKHPEGIAEYLNTVAHFQFEEEPKYDLLRNILKTAMKRAGCKVDGILIFTEKSSPLKRRNESEISSVPHKVQRNRKASNPHSFEGHSKGQAIKSDVVPDDSLDNPTPAMLMIQQRMKEQALQKRKSPRKKKLMK